MAPTALKITSDDSQLSGTYALYVRGCPVFFEAKTCGSGEVLCAQSMLFPARLNRTREARVLCGFTTTQVETSPVFNFPTS